MYIIVVGAGEQGFFLTRLLSEENHDVVVIDKDPIACERVANELDVLAIKGDGTHPDTLKKAGIEEADALVALTDTDETNMIIGLMAKELGAKQVVARIGKVHFQESVLRKLGIDIVIHPEAAAATYVAEIITKPDVLDLAFVSRGAAEILEIAVNKDMKIAGQKVKNIEHPAGTAIIALYEDEKMIIPEAETIVKAGQKMLILAQRDVADKVRKMFK